MTDNTIDSSEWNEQDELVRSIINFLDLDNPEHYEVRSSKTCSHKVEWLRLQGNNDSLRDEETIESHQNTTSDEDDEQNLITISDFNYSDTSSLMPTLDEYLRQTPNISLLELFLGRDWTSDDSVRILNRMSQVVYKNETSEEYDIRLCNEIYHDMRYLTEDGALPLNLSEEEQRGLFLEIYEKIQLATWDKIQQDEINLITERLFDDDDEEEKKNQERK